MQLQPLINAALDVGSNSLFDTYANGKLQSARDCCVTAVYLATLMVMHRKYMLRYITAG
jgi:hypothetical protein